MFGRSVKSRSDLFAAARRCPLDTLRMFGRSVENPMKMLDDRSVNNLKLF